ncbi:MAG: FAD-dependent oxidoreductase [Saprospiraceae bacterium]|nr:FAD-dependent oxidoreductase [Saprospiraceae bacterium]MCC6842508.1 FAD-dependent oxidoreductase [Saprospiraceae bacterium]HRG34135.1 FAD-dependent oxidoreductase [Saprospiraceae bacterium]
MKRRTFIIQSAIGTAAWKDIGSNLPAPNFNSSKKVKSVCIIGAGFAGLMAAHTLKERGIKVTILEAKNRIGGRVFSHHPSSAPDQVIELGAEWVGQSHELIIGLCKKFNLILENNQFETHLTFNGQYFKDGKWSLSPAFNTFWAAKKTIWKNMPEKQKKKLDRTDWWRFLSDKKFDDRDLMLRELMDSTDFGESIRHVSAYAAYAEYAESSEKNEMDLKIKGGNSQLTEALSKSIGIENILLSHKVNNIIQNKNGVQLHCENGSTFEADKLICAVPTFSLRKIQWAPQLPEIMVDALAELQYARIGKFPMVFSEKFWKQENFDMVTDTPAHYFYHATKNQNVPGGTLICYATGDKAESLNSISSEQRKSIILDALKPAFGDVGKYLKEDLKFYWGNEPASYGAYALYGVKQWFDVMPVLSEPFQNTLFAGEHLADWQGFMEGALQSGKDAAEKILGK